MTDTHVVSALREKRARLAGELQEVQWRVIALRTELGSVDNCLKLFAKGIDPETIPAKVTTGKNPAGLPKGAGSRTALEILRETGEAMTSMELAACILERHGKPLERRALKMLTVTIQANFSRRPDKIVEFDRSTYARHQLKTINPEQERNKSEDGGGDKRPKVTLPDWLMQMEICKELHRIAAMPDHDESGDDPDESDKTVPVDAKVPLQGAWATTYSTLFEHHWDRRIVTFLTVVSGVVLVVGPANEINAWRFLIPLFTPAVDHHPNAQTDVVFYLLVAALTVPMIFVWLGKKVVTWGRERVRQLVRDCKIAMQRPAQEAAVNVDGNGPVTIPQPVLPALPNPNSGH